jgi:CheY-like chemotaxis protein
MLSEVADLDIALKDYIKTINILCVDDDMSTRFIYESIFEDSVGKLICSKDGQEGYENFLENDIDIVITDYSMPVLDGIGMIKKIRENNSDIPIILVSSIENTDIIKSAISLHISNFIEKPIDTSEVIQAVLNAAKILIANKYIKEQKNKRLRELEEKDKYTAYQEDLAFAKELNILRNDFYYQMIQRDYTAMVDFMYRPLDTISGDAYSARSIDENRIFFLLVDGMGKGISASLSAIIFTTFVNYLIDKSDDLDLEWLIEESMNYIKPILLEEETLSVDYVLLNCQDKQMSYAKFSMPPSLIQTEDNEIVKIKSNNPPMSKYSRNYKVSTYDTSNSIKFLFYSDGLVESETRIKGRVYAEFIEDDFYDSFAREDMREKLLWKVEEQEDDMTFIYFSKLNLNRNIVEQKVISSSLSDIDKASEWYNELWESFSDNVTLQYNAGVVFTELIMNAYEHGNLGLTAQHKHKLLEEDTYFSTLEAMEKECDKNITIVVNKIIYNNHTYIITNIKDEGEGFDTNILSEIFRNKARFNGRGVFVSRRSSYGIYYNSKGNEVLYLHKVS